VLIYITHGGFAEAQKPSIVQHTKAVAAWALQPSTGRTFCTLVGEREVYEYDSQGKRVRSIEVGPQASQMLIKGDKLVVFCLGDDSVRIIDLKTNKPLGRIFIDSKVQYFFCSKSKNNFVYVWGKTPPITPVSQNNDVIEVLDIQNIEVHRTIACKENSAFRGKPQMSDDGKWVGSPSNSRGYFYVDETVPEFIAVHGLHVRDPLHSRDRLSSERDDKVFGTPTFFSRNPPIDESMKNKVKKALKDEQTTHRTAVFPRDDLAIHPSYDLKASEDWGDRALELKSFGGNKNIVTIPMPKLRTGKSRGKEYNRFSERIVFFGNSIFIGKEFGGIWFDLSKHIDQLPPRVTLTGPRKVEVIAGEKTELEFNWGQFADSFGVRARLTGEPAGVELQGSRVLFPETEVGTYSFTLEVFQNETVLDSMVCEVDVRAPSLEFDFEPNGMILSDCGKFGMVYRNENRRSSTVAVCDLVTRRLIQPLYEFTDGAVSTPCMNEKYVCWSSKKKIWVSDLALENIKHYSLKNGPVTNLRLVSPAVLQIKMKQRHSGSGELLLDLETMEKSTGAYWEPLTQNARKLKFTEKGPFHKAIFPYRGVPHPGTGISKTEPFLWGQKVVPPINPYLGNPSTVSEAFPLRADLQIVQPNPRKYVRHLEIKLTGLEKPQEEHVSLSLVANYVPSQRSSFGGIVQAKNDKVYALLGSRLYCREIPKSFSEALTMRPHFSWDQTKRLPVEGIQTFKLNTLGSIDGLRFHFGQEQDGFSLDEKAGLVSLNTTKLWAEKIVYYWSDARLRLSKNSARRIGQQYQNDFQKSLSLNHRSYRLIAGKQLPADKFAIVERLSVMLYRDQKLLDKFEFPILLIGPAADIAKRINDFVRSPTTKALGHADKPFVIPDSARIEATNLATEQKIEEIEKRIRINEAIIESLEKQMGTQDEQ